MTHAEVWKCAGCGKEAPGKVKQCVCPTSVVYTGNGRDMQCVASIPDPAKTFSDWVSKGPELALAAGLYVGIKIYASEADARAHGDIS